MVVTWQALAAVLVVVAVVVAGSVLRRRGRPQRQAGRKGAVADGPAVPQGGLQPHVQVRAALLAVLLVAGGHTLFLTWQAESALERHVQEAEATNLAGRQRMYSQRIGRLASLLASPDGRSSVDTGALADVVRQTRSEGARLERFIADRAATGSDSLDAAVVARWQSAREMLASRAAALLEASAAGPVRSADVAAVQAAVEPALVAAEQLVAAVEALLQARHERELRRSRLLSLATVALLVGLGLIVAEPTTRAVRAQYLRIRMQTRQLEQLALVAELTKNAVVITDERLRMVWVNDAFTQITGYTAQEALGRTLVELLRSEPEPRLEQLGLDAAAGPASAPPGEGRQSARALLQNRRKDGSELWLDVDIQPLGDRTDGGRGFVAVASDVTERRRAQADLRVAAIAFNSLEAIVVTDAKQAILRVNPAFTRITGYTAAEARGQVVGRLLRSGRQDAAFYEAMWRQLRETRHWQGELWNRRKDGQIYPEWLSITAVTDEDGQVANYVAVFTDITQKKVADETIHNLAFYDPLTDLPNRRLMLDRLEQIRAAGARGPQRAAVLFLDLDNFKELNDTRGHGVGDALLVEAARRLRTCVRVHDTVARQGGDEFVVILGDLHPVLAHATRDVEAVAEKIRAALSQAYLIDGVAWHCTASIGICMLQGGDDPVDEILKRADIAMYEAKRSGRNAARFYDPATQRAIQQRIELEADLRSALADRQFVLHYQMQVDSARRVIGAEVLLRWRHPQRGLVSPGDFIPVAEDSDLILPIGRWVLCEACRQLRVWAESPQTRDLQLAVNVSARQFKQPDFAEQVAQALRDTGADPRLLKLELTESLVLVNVEQTLAKMRAIRALGVRFAIDDFGTGQSSLAYLTKLSLDQLKIDQAFVAGMLESHTDGVIVQTMIGMAQTLGLDVIAEGVETEEQLAFLRTSGCHCYQGYLFGRPLPIEQFMAQIEQHALIAANG